MYPQLRGNTAQQQPYRAPYGATSSSTSQPSPYHHTTVVVQPSPTYGGGGGYGGYHGGGGGGSSLAGVGLGLAGGALLGGKTPREFSLIVSFNFSSVKVLSVMHGEVDLVTEVGDMVWDLQDIMVVVVTGKFQKRQVQ